VLKGAMLFRLWENQPHRPTRDLDLLGSYQDRVALASSRLDVGPNSRVENVQESFIKTTVWGGRWV
jgi:hypothetical protein